jgi:hypothetical protein
MIKNKHFGGCIMVTQTYIGKVKSEKFDYDISCKEKWNTGYSPEPIMYIPDDIRRIYMDIVRDVIDKKENTKQTDWGCFVIKMKKDDLINYLSKQKYNSNIPELNNNEIHLKKHEEYKNFIINIEKLESEKEYLLVAKELG